MINLILHSRYGDEYEIVAGGGVPLSSCGCRYDADDFTYTRQFISHLLVTPEAWRNLLRRLGYSLPPNINHPAEIFDVVARFCLRGVLAFYKLPRIESLQALSSGEGWGICLVKGPNPHCHSELEVFEVGTPEEAEALLDSVSATEQNLVRVMFVNNMTQWFSFDGDTRGKVIQMLAKRELLAYKVEVTENAPPPKAADYVAAAGPGYDKVSLGPESNASPAPAKVEPVKTQPQSLQEAAQRLKDAKPAVDAAKAAGKPLPSSNYTLADKQAVIENGLQERYLVRIIDSEHATDTGLIGKRRAHGGSISWTAPLSMVEHGDTDPEALLKAFGTRYDPAKKYTVLIIDIEKMNKTGNVQAIIPTNQNLKKLLAEHPRITSVRPEVAEKVLNPEFAPKYYKFAKDMTAKKIDQQDPDTMKKFAKRQGFSESESDLLIERHKLANEVAAWEEFTGNGMTLDTNIKNGIAYGPVEVLMLDKKPKTLLKLEKNKTLVRIPC